MRETDGFGIHSTMGLLMRSLIVGVLGWSILVGPAMAEDGAKKDLAKLVGTWKLVSMDDGKGAKETDGFQIVISEKRLEFRAPNGKKKTMGEIGRIDGSEKPAQIDLKNGNESGLGIYELDGDNL
jgi:uncharacterized protein (TIGR03067 family)